MARRARRGLGLVSGGAGRLVREAASAVASFSLLDALVSAAAAVLAAAGLSRASRCVRFSLREEGPDGLPGVSRFVLARYLMKELFLYFFIAFVFFFMVFFVNQILLVAEKILKQRVPVTDVLRLMAYSLPMVIAQSAPFATLVGFLMCLGRLATDNEILILRASGQGYRLILAPVVVLGVLISVASFFVNDYLLPLGTIEYNRLYRSILTSNPAVELESNSVKRTSDKTLVIGQVDGERVSDLVFFDTDGEGKPRVIVADSSVVRKSGEPGVLMTLEMDDASVVFLGANRGRTYDYMDSERLDLNIFESSLGGVGRRTTPREMTSYDLYNKIKEMEVEGNYTGKVMNQHVLELNKKFSMPFGSIFFALLAMPLALIFGKHNGQTIGLIIGLLVSVAYWAVSIVGQIFSSRSGVHGALTMWAPNVLVGLAGAAAYVRLVRK